MRIQYARTFKGMRPRIFCWLSESAFDARWDTIGLLPASPASQVSNIAYELLVARRGRHVPFVTFGHWAWGDIDRRNDAFRFARTAMRTATTLPPPSFEPPSDRVRRHSPASV